MAAISKFDKRMFKAARQMAQDSDFKNFHTGCVIVYKKHIIGAGFNSDKTHPMQAQYNKFRKFNHTKNGIKHSIHAEIAAINSISYVTGRDIDWSKVKMYISRICPGHASGQGLSKPCSACQAAIQDLGIRHVYYTIDDGYAYEEFI